MFLDNRFTIQTAKKNKNVKKVSIYKYSIHLELYYTNNFDIFGYTFNVFIFQNQILN